LAGIIDIFTLRTRNKEQGTRNKEQGTRNKEQETRNEKQEANPTIIIHPSALRQLQLTADGSHTISIPELNVSYHSHHGAIQESMHVFVQAGLQLLFERFPDDPVRVLEIGFGTGLNALLSAREAGARQRAVVYTGIEKYPLTAEESSQLNYGSLSGLEEIFRKINEAAWENETAVSPWFRLRKLHLSLPAAFAIEPVHGIYLDPFAPDMNPELWSQAFFEDAVRHPVTGGYPCYLLQQKHYPARAHRGWIYRYQDPRPLGQAGNGEGRKITAVFA
jgi:tRNA U34 5-methylaminomethyl-2-thiouridine-forming methyltransferase MnmC